MRSDRRGRAARHQEEKLAALRARRDNRQVRRSLDALKRAAEGTENTMPFFWTPSAPMPRWARSAAGCGTSSAATRKPPSIEGGRKLSAAHMPIRVLVAKPGLDGHDRGAKVIARALRDAGMEVIYTGLRQTPEMIVNAALQEDVRVIGLSILSGAHNAIVPRVMELLREKDMTDVKVVVGGIIPNEDAEALKRDGVAAVFQPGASLDAIVEFIRRSGADSSLPRRRSCRRSSSQQRKRRDESRRGRLKVCATGGQQE